jgi:hypothetical protein
VTFPLLIGPARSPFALNASDEDCPRPNDNAKVRRKEKTMTNNSEGFAGKVAFVTGGASGIGRAAALAFAREGACVAVADVFELGNQETARMIEQQGGKERRY